MWLCCIKCFIFWYIWLIMFFFCVNIFLKLILVFLILMLNIVVCFIVWNILVDLSSDLVGI